MFFRQFLLLHKSDRQVIALLLVLALVGVAVIMLTGRGEQTAQPEAVADSDSIARPQAPVTAYRQEPAFVAERFPFDPNTADSTQLLRLGLQSWQVRGIYKYRSRGGIYREKEDFARVPGLTVGQYRQLEPYIRIGRDYQPAAAVIVKKREEERDSVYRSHKLADHETVDLALADTTQLQLVPGIGSYYARRIADYGRRLGGYVSIDQLDEIEGFPTGSKRFFVMGEPHVQLLNLNRLSLNELRRHPYINYYQARAIVDYRRQHGPLSSLDDLRLLRDFPQEARDRLAPYVEF